MDRTKRYVDLSASFIFRRLSTAVHACSFCLFSFVSTEISEAAPAELDGLGQMIQRRPTMESSQCFRADIMAHESKSLHYAAFDTLSAHGMRGVLGLVSLRHRWGVGGTAKDTVSDSRKGQLQVVVSTDMDVEMRTRRCVMETDRAVVRTSYSAPKPPIRSPRSVSVRAEAA